MGLGTGFDKVNSIIMIGVHSIKVHFQIAVKSPVVTNKNVTLP